MKDGQAALSSISGETSTFEMRLREAIGDKTPASVARAAGVAKQTMDSYLKGSMPSADRALALADTLGVPVRWLVTGEIEPPRTSDLDQAEWVLLPRFNLGTLRGGRKAAGSDFVPVRRDWLSRRALAAPSLWITQMPASTLPDVPAESDMIVCCDSSAPHGEGLYLYRYRDVPVARRFVAHGAVGPNMMDVTTFEFTGMELLGRVLGALKLQEY